SARGHHFHPRAHLLMGEARSAEPRAESALLLMAAFVAGVAPLAIGGVHVPVQLSLAAAALALFLAYAWLRGERGLRPVAFLGAAVVAVGFTFAQLVPLPAIVVGLLSPAARILRDETTGGARFMPLSLDAPATGLALVRGLGCLSLLLIVGGLVQSRTQARRVLGVLVGFGTAIAVVALAQRAAGVQTILGFYRPRSTPGFGVYGPFVDVNHAAALLTLTALMAIGLAAELRGTARF